MKDIAEEWRCPHCGWHNWNCRSHDLLLLCHGDDCIDPSGKRFTATWEEVDSGFPAFSYRSTEDWHKLIEGGRDD